MARGSQVVIQTDSGVLPELAPNSADQLSSTNPAVSVEGLPEEGAI